MDPIGIDDTPVAVEPCVATPPLRHSTRHQPWYVYPINYAGVLDVSGYGPKIHCGNLFNSEAERLALGQTVGEGEECCISLEPIADACLSFAPELQVMQLYPEFTGVQLCCGHRFSAVCLLWYWALNSMICPICRAKYAIGAEEPVQASPWNFPLHSCIKLARRIDGIKKAEDTAQQLADREFIMDSLLQETMQDIVQQTIQSVLGYPRSFHVMLSLENDVSSTVVQCLQLHRNPSSSAGLVGRMIFNVQYSHLRRFNSVSATDPTTDIYTPRSHNLTASLVMVDPMSPDRMVEISSLALVDIERGVAIPTVSMRCVDIQGHMDVEFCQRNPTETPPRILSLAFNVDTSSLLEAVARLFTYQVTYVDDYTTTTISLTPPNESYSEPST